MARGKEFHGLGKALLATAALLDVLTIAACSAGQTVRRPSAHSTPTPTIPPTTRTWTPDQLAQAVAIADPTFPAQDQYGNTQITLGPGQVAAVDMVAGGTIVVDNGVGREVVVGDATAPEEVIVFENNTAKPQIINLFDAVNPEVFIGPSGTNVLTGLQAGDFLKALAKDMHVVAGGKEYTMIVGANGIVSGPQYTLSQAIATPVPCTGGPECQPTQAPSGPGEVPTPTSVPSGPGQG